MGIFQNEFCAIRFTDSTKYVLSYIFWMLSTSSFIWYKWFCPIQYNKKNHFPNVVWKGVFSKMNFVYGASLIQPNTYFYTYSESSRRPLSYGISYFVQFNTVKEWYKISFLKMAKKRTFFLSQSMEKGSFLTKKAHFWPKIKNFRTFSKNHLT